MLQPGDQVKAPDTTLIQQYGYTGDLIDIYRQATVIQVHRSKILVDVIFNESQRISKGHYIYYLQSVNN